MKYENKVSEKGEKISQLNRKECGKHLYNSCMMWGRSILEPKEVS